MRCSLSLAVLLLVCSNPAKSDIITTYDPNFGTLPEFQGFTRVENGSPTPPAPTVSGGILFQGPTVNANEQFWRRNDVSFDFSQGFSIEVDLKVISSGYFVGSGGQRSGYSATATDSTGRRFWLGIAGDGVTVNTDLNAATTNGISKIFMDTTDAIHIYRLDVVSGVGTLFIDNVSQGSTPAGAVIQSSTDFNKVIFGDLVTQAGSQTQLALLQYVVPVPEPSTLILLGTVLTPVLSRRILKNRPL